MGLSSSKSKTSTQSTSTNAPLAQFSPYINQGLQNAQGVFQANQGNLQNLSASALAGYNAIAPAAYSPSPYVTAAQHTAQGIASGQNIGTNPGAATYGNLMSAQNPSLGALQGLVGSATANPAAAGLSQLGSSYSNPATSALSAIANGGTSNPALAAYGKLLNGGSNSAIPGLTSYAYGTGSLGAGDATLTKFQNTGTNGMSNYADSYDRSVLSGKYLNNNPYIDAIADQATGAATKAANQRFGQSGLGAGLSSAYTSALGSAVADANNTVRYNAYNSERQLQDAASGRISSNFNAGQDRALSGANALSAGSRADAAFRLGALNDLSGANQQRTANQLAAAAGLGSAYQGDVANRLSAAGTLGSQYDAGYNSQAGVLGKLGSIYDQGQQNAQSAASALGSQYQAQNAGQLAAAGQADQSYQGLLQQQLSALGLTGGLTDAQYAGISPALSLLGASASIPYQGVQSYAGLVNGLTQGYGTNTSNGTQTVTKTPSLVDQIGRGLQIGGQVASVFSDRRLKVNISKVGEEADGLGVYDFDYVWGGRHRGVMADEVAALRPWALGAPVNGFATVNYGAL